MGQLAVFTTAAHYEDVRPNVVLPYAAANGTEAVIEAVKLNLAVQGLHPRMFCLEGDYDYDLLLRRLWKEGSPFVIVEHDIVPWPGAIDELWACPEPWCGFPYQVLGGMRSYLGCVKFDPGHLGAVPLPVEPTEWSRIDRSIDRRLVGLGLRQHRHGPPVTHLHFAHSRMGDTAVVHPRFWKNEEI